MLGLCFVIQYLESILVLKSSKEEIAGGFILILFLLSCLCLCSVSDSLICDAMRWSMVCD